MRRRVSEEGDRECGGRGRVIESVVGEGRIEIFFEYKKLRSWLNLLIELKVIFVVFIIVLFTLRIQYSHLTRKIQSSP